MVTSVWVFELINDEKFMLYFLTPSSHYLNRFGICLENSVKLQIKRSGKTQNLIQNFLWHSLLPVFYCIPHEYKI